MELIHDQIDELLAPKGKPVSQFSDADLVTDLGYQTCLLTSQ
jgi:hypothetical protein